MAQAAYATSKAPHWSRVASLTNREVVAAKSSFAIMTSRAALAATSCMMIERFGSCDLSSLRHARLDLVTRITRLFLVLRMAKADAKRLREFRRP
jgi:hypothetical protein